jgi:hypothetical protein
LLAAITQAHDVAESRNRITEDLLIQAWPGYFNERCMELASGSKIELSVVSPHALDLNIHYHTDTSTEYLISTVVTDDSVHVARTRVAGEYCVEIRNSERRDANFTVRMTLNIEPG